MPPFLKHASVGGAVFLTQWLILGRLQLWGAYPDLVLLYVAWVGLRFGRLNGLFAGAGLGLLMDAVYGTWGIHLLTKSVTGFLIGLFPADHRANLVIRPTQAFLGGLVIAILHNGLQVIFYAVEAGTSNVSLIGGLWLGSAFYTAFVATVITTFATS